MSNADQQLVGLEEGHAPPNVTRSAVPSTPMNIVDAHQPETRSRDVRYIAPQTNPLAGTFTQAASQSPGRLFISDAVVLASMFRYLPNVLLPRTRYENPREDYLDKSRTRDIVLQCVLVIVEVLVLFLLPIPLLLLPGLLSIAIIAICWLLVAVLMYPMQGARVAYSKPERLGARSTHRHQDEQWIFVNGILTGSNGLQKNINVLSQAFGRPIIGIHNETYGFPFDLLECLIQRCFSYNTLDVRITYEYLKASLYDPAVKRLVLIGHSQGGLIVAMALDHLYADLPRDLFDKLEIYTFGSAAKHFNNPPLAVDGGHKERSIKYIEHYANEKDLVARWGPLYNIDQIPNNRYSGRVFVRNGGSGHLFIEHYLSVMFPLPSSFDDGALVTPRDLPNDFLDQIVSPDGVLSSRRQTAAWMNLESSVTTSRKDSMFSNEDGMVIEGAVSQGQDPTADRYHEEDAGGVKDAQGKTVRQLSRLWKYLGGATPEA